MCVGGLGTTALSADGTNSRECLYTKVWPGCLTLTSDSATAGGLFCLALTSLFPLPPWHDLDSVTADALTLRTVLRTRLGGIGGIPSKRNHRSLKGDACAELPKLEGLPLVAASQRILPFAVGSPSRRRRGTQGVSMRMRLDTARSRILDVIDMYCFECSRDLRYSKAVLNNYLDK